MTILRQPRPGVFGWFKKFDEHLMQDLPFIPHRLCIDFRTVMPVLILLGLPHTWCGVEEVS